MNMASASETSIPVPTCNKKASLTCGVCLDIFTQPKILPCFHIFCLKCLESLPVSLKGRGRKFTCPTCRERITVPAGGVSTFKTDFHIDTEELEKARNGLFCKQHPSKDLDLYCDDCKMPACTKCMFLTHKGHEMLDMAEVTAKNQLQEDRGRLKRAASKVETNMGKVEKDQEEVLKKKRALEQIAHDKHSALHAVADIILHETLASLSSVTDSIKENQANDLKKQLESLQQVKDLERQVQQALDGKMGCEQVVSVASEMKSGSGSDNSLQKITAQHTTAVSRPVLHCTARPNVLLQQMRDYMGRAVKMEMTVSQPVVTVAEQLSWWQNPDTDVFCVCPSNATTVFISYRSRPFLDELPAEKYTIRGKEIRREEENTKGCVTYFNKGILKGKNFKQGRIFSKSATVFMVMESGAGAFRVSKVRDMVEGQNPRITATDIFTIYDCDSVRAADASSDEQLFAVVQQTETQDPKRKVKVYRVRQRVTNSRMYISPVRPFLPSDVCFFTLGGQEVLLVADELNDAIHVVNVRDERPSFLRYLAPGCPLLVQPTTLNTDPRGRLWVACRGGKILTCSEGCGDQFDDGEEEEGEDNGDDVYEYDDDDDDDDDDDSRESA